MLFFILYLFKIYLPFSHIFLTNPNDSIVKSQNVDEKLKANNQMEWVRLMNNFKKSAEDIVLSELIYN